MKCSNCNSEWNASPQMMSSLKKCPFCGKPLTLATAQNTSTLESVLCQISADYGLEPLRNGRQMIGYFSDLAPDLNKEFRMLKYLVEADCHTVLFNARNSGPAEQKLSMEKAVRKLADEFLVDEDTVRVVCAAYWTAVSGVHTYLNLADKNTHSYTPDSIALSQEGMDEIFERVFLDYSTTYDYDDDKKVQILQMFSVQGHAKSQCELAHAYDYEWYGIKQNYSEAVKWYRRAAEQGYADAQLGLSRAYEFGWGVNQNLSEAVKWCRRAAEQGDWAAQQRMGVMYEFGDGIPKNLGQAFYWYSKAAEHGDNAFACEKLGEMYSEGNGVKKNTETAAAWYLKAAELFGEQLPEYMAGCYRQVAELGDAKGQCKLGFCYLKGVGVPQDRTEAFKWLRKSADQGNIMAKDYLDNYF